MVRTGGLEYTIAPTASMGQRISNMRLAGKAIDPNRAYKVAGWAPVAEEARHEGNKQVWELVEQWLKSRGGKVSARKPNTPKII